MDWYDKLSEYFPAYEMKHPGQMEELLSDHPAYKKHETHEYLVTYAEFAKFIFIDYLLVNPNIRGKGLGSQALSMFKRKGKTVILEVEPPDTDRKETLQRIRFYERNGFQRAEHIVYTRSDDDGEPFAMDVYYWSPTDVPQREILKQMTTICRDIHNFKSEHYYGRMIADPDDVLEWEH